MPDKEAPKLYRHTDAFGLKPCTSVLKSLVEQGRIPVLDEVMEGSRRVIHCYVPPADTKPGDSTFYLGRIKHFMSPEKELRGRPDFFVLTPSQAAELKERITVFEAKVNPKE